MQISKDIKFHYLEIGSHEGMSLLNNLEQYKNVHTACIDLWTDTVVKKVFDENFKNLDKIKSDTIIALRKLNDNKKREFDYIYILMVCMKEHMF